MSRVLHLIASSRGGGAGHVLDLAPGLARSGFDVQVAMPEDGGHVARQDFEAAGIPFQGVEIATGLSWSALRQIRELVRGVDILHVHGARAALFGRLAAASLGKQRPRLIYTIHGFAAVHYAMPKRWVLLTLERVLARVTDMWICVANAECTALLAAGIADARRVHVVWNGIHVERFSASQASREQVCKELGLPHDAFLATTVVRLYRPRDFQTLLLAFSSIAQALPQAHLLIVGDGPLRDEVEQRTISLGLQSRVHLLGMRRDVPQLLSVTNVFVLSSKGWEGLPLTVLEAMAASVPVVASDVGGTGEAVVDGHTGYLFAPGDACQLAAHVLALASDPSLAQHLGHNGLLRAQEHFTLQRMIRETATLYKQVLVDTRSLKHNAGIHCRKG